MLGIRLWGGSWGEEDEKVKWKSKVGKLRG